MAKPRARLLLRTGLAAVVLTGLNALKPVAIDDTLYVAFARQIAAHPGDPYGFEVFWYDAPQPALSLIVPVGLSYWLAPGVALLGERPVLWKLWLLPYALLLTAALGSLLGRFARGREGPLLWMAVLSPTVLPGFNLMLDVPALALGVAAVAVFLRACDGDRLPGALLAGLLGGLAMQTKYNALLPVGALLVYAALARRWRLGLAAGGVAGALAIGWEVWLALRYGEWHLLSALPNYAEAVPSLSALQWGIGWLALLGALGLPLALLGLLALGARPALVAGAVALASTPFALVPALEPPMLTILAFPVRLAAGDPLLDLFFAAGLGVALVAAALCNRALRAPDRADRRAALFLVGWLAIEVAGCVVLSPFHAARRLMGLLVVGTLLAGHVAAREERSRPLLHGVAAWGAALGLLFALSDLADARARLRLHDAVAAELRALGANPARQRIWFSGHWGFQYYAERRGYRPLVAGQSELRPGDWLVITSGIYGQRLVPFPASPPLAWVETSSPLPWSTMPSAYAGAVPIRRQPRAHVGATIHRAVRSQVLPVR